MKLRKTFVAVIYAILLPLLASSQPDWHVQTSPVQDDLVSVSFADTLNGWAVSDSGTVIHTTDGGLTWEVQHNIDRFLPEKIFFQDKQTGWLAGVNSSANDTASILSTMDGGATWDTSYMMLHAKIYDIFFINDTMGWTVGFGGDTLGLRLHTIDGGQTWNVQAGINVVGIFTSVHFRDTEEGDICGPGPVMMHTNSGGRGTSPWALEITNLKKPMYDLVNLGELYGCMVGADGKLFFTKDQWNNFIESDYEGGDTLWAVDAIEPMGFWVVGESGTILFVGYNEFLGLTVQDQSRDIQQDLLDLVAVDDAHAWTVGEEGTILFFGFAPSSGILNPTIDSLVIFPNPAGYYVQVVNIQEGIDRIELFDMNGRLVMAQPIAYGQQKTIVDLSDMDTGSYILQAGDDRRKLIVLKQ